LTQTYFDQWVQYFSLLEVCYFKSDGDCYGYDEKYPDEQKSTFNPMAGMVFLAVITHLILLVTFSFLGAAQVFSKHIKGTAVDRALCLENNSIPIGTLCLSLFAALLHFITIMILTTSDLYNASTGSSILSLQTYCSADFAASGVDNGGDLDDGFDVDGGGLVRYLADANVPDFGPADALSTELTRGVGPAMVLTVLLFLCAMGEALYIRLSCSSTFGSSASKELDGTHEANGSFGGGNYAPRLGGHGKHLSGIMESPHLESPSSSSSFSSNEGGFNSKASMEAPPV